MLKTNKNFSDASAVFGSFVSKSYRTQREVSRLSSRPLRISSRIPTFYTIFVIIVPFQGTVLPYCRMTDLDERKGLNTLSKSGKIGFYSISFPSRSLLTLSTLYHECTAEQWLAQTVDTLNDKTSPKLRYKVR